MKKPTARQFSRAALKSVCQSLHRPLASRRLTPLTFGQADAYHIHGIGMYLRDWLECPRNAHRVAPTTKAGVKVVARRSKSLWTQLRVYMFVLAPPTRGPPNLL